MAKLYFYYSAMNAGKTTTLLQSSYNYQERGMKTLLFTPKIDVRYGEGKIASRIGLESNALAFEPDFNFYNHVKKILPTIDRLACILVDEAQFLTPHQVKQLAEVVDTFKIPVLSYGLRTDFRGHLFDGSAALLALADELIELKTICHCGSKATMNARIDKNGNVVHAGETIEIGGNDRYISLCRKHYFKGETASEKLVTSPQLKRA